MFLTQTQLLTPLQRMQRAHVEIMGHKSTMEYASVLLVGKYEMRDDVRTACTDGINVKYGSAFITKLGDPELRGLVLHENLHKCFQHLFVWQHLYADDPKLANKACDYVINILIDDLDKSSGGFVKLPPGGLLDQRFRDMSSQEVFDILKQEKEEGEEGGEGDGPLDDHDWDAGRELSQDEIEEVKREIDQAIRQGQLMAGKLGGDQSRALGALTEPKVDWREQLRDFVSALCAGKDLSTWQRPNRRWLQHDIYMPSTISETIGRIVIAVDTSGSIHGQILTGFLNEVQGIANNVKPEKIDLIYWDTEVAAHEVYAQDNLDRLATSTKPRGGGGTDVTCVSEYLKKNQIRPECVIVLTDGYLSGDWGTWSAPVLWCICGNANATAPVGTTIHID